MDPRRVCAWLGCLLPALAAQGQDPAAYFRQSCFSCHTIGGGRLTGPDLKDVESRQSRDWLIKFIVDPKGVLDSGDAYALKLKDEARGAIMTQAQGITPELAGALLDFIAAESAKPESEFKGLTIGEGPFKPEQVAAGRRLFTGAQPLAGGGPACVSCHTVATAGGLGGGRMAPDLTRVQDRIVGRKALAAWLQAPPTPTMSRLFKGRALKSDEILPLLAFIEDAAASGRQVDNVAPINFLLLGMVGAVAGLLAFDAVWKHRFRAVRRPQVEAARRRR